MTYVTILLYLYMAENEDKKMTIGRFAKSIGRSRQSVYQKIERGTFEKEVKEIGGVKFVILD